jgi:hypothetical protein
MTTMPKHFVIFSEMETAENSGNPLFWSNQDGWGSLETATVFTEKEKNSLTLPLPDGAWVMLPELPALSIKADMEEALRRHDIQAADIQHKLRIFATHISTLVRADAGAKFGLSFWGSVYVDVEVEPDHTGKNNPTWNSYSFTVNGKREQVGNFAGAYKRYAQLCAPAFALHQGAAK